jgi:hypothetical protein
MIKVMNCFYIFENDFFNFGHMWSWLVHQNKKIIIMKRQMKYEFSESPLQKCYFSQVSNLTIIRCNLKLEMKLKKKTILHIKTLFQIVAILKMCGPRI